MPEGKLDLVYKDYTPELLQYYRLARRTDYLPFRFLCYFHILEYFADRSAYKTVTDAVRRVICRHDFHVKAEKYIQDCVKILRKEADKHTNDKTKIKRVLTQFIAPQELKQTLEDLGLLEHFESECVIDSSKQLKLKALNFESDSQLLETLTSRIYSMRCSIVHSNPDFDETKAIPFVATPENLDKLRTETLIAGELARQIIAGSANGA